MTTYVLRHGQTNYSRRYLVNGDPTKPIRLSEDGRRSLSQGWCSDSLHGTPGGAMPLFFPEAAYIESVAIPDGELPEFIGALMNDLETGVLDRAVGSGDREVMRIGEGASVATFDPVSHHSPDQKDLPHA